MKTIEQYIATEMSGKVERRSKSPLVGIVVLALGIGMLVLMNGGGISDSLSALMLVVGVACLGVGLVVTAMCIGGAMSYYRYKPTGSLMHRTKVYLTPSDYATAVAAIGRGDMGALAALQRQTSSNTALDMLVANDGEALLLQAGTFETGHFEPETEVKPIFGTEVATLKVLCK